MAEPILSLDVFETRFVAIGPPGHQVDYELAHPGSLSLVAMRRREKLQERYESLLQSIKARDSDAVPLSDEDEEREARQLSGLLVELVRMCLKAPDDVIASIGDQGRLAVLQAFTQPRQEEQAQPAGEAAPAQPSTGESGSPG